MRGTQIGLSLIEAIKLGTAEKTAVAIALTGTTEIEVAITTVIVETQGAGVEVGTVTKSLKAGGPHLATALRSRSSIISAEAQVEAEMTATIIDHHTGNLHQGETP